MIKRLSFLIFSALWCVPIIASCLILVITGIIISSIVWVCSEDDIRDYFYYTFDEVVNVPYKLFKYD